MFLSLCFPAASLFTLFLLFLYPRFSLKLLTTTVWSCFSIDFSLLSFSLFVRLFDRQGLCSHVALLFLFLSFSLLYYLTFVSSLILGDERSLLRNALHGYLLSVWLRWSSLWFEEIMRIQVLILIFPRCGRCQKYFSTSPSPYLIGRQSMFYIQSPAF